MINEKQRVRGFEVVTTYSKEEVQLPVRATQHSAGYDFFAAKDIMVPSMLKQLGKWMQTGHETAEKETDLFGSVLIPTGVKAYMPEGEYLLLANRSSNPMKNRLALPNGIGVVDADYYGNEKNDGEIFFQMINYGVQDFLVRKGDRIGQGIFSPYKTVDEEETPQQIRSGGFGSSGK